MVILDRRPVAESLTHLVLLVDQLRKQSRRGYLELAAELADMVPGRW